MTQETNVRVTRSVTNAWRPTVHKMRLLGVALVGLGVFCVYVFTANPTGGIPGFPHAWRGASLILGASFFGIVGCFLILQRRFSLAALLVAGIAASTLAGAAQAYVRSIREVVSLSRYMTVRSNQIPQFIARSRDLVTPDVLQKFADDMNRTGWLKSEFDFESAMMTYGVSSIDKEEVKEVTLTLNLEICPLIQPDARYSRASVKQYSDFIHRWATIKFQDSNQSLKAAIFVTQEELEILVDTLVQSSGVLIGTKTNSAEYRKPRYNALKWLRDREPNTEIKNYLSGALTDFEENGK